MDSNREPEGIVSKTAAGQSLIAYQRARITDAAMTRSGRWMRNGSTPHPYLPAAGQWCETCGCGKDGVQHAPAAGDRVAYTVMYGGRPGHHFTRTEYGRITRIRTGGARQEPRATIAAENPKPGSARYVERYLSDVTSAPLPEPVYAPGQAIEYRIASRDIQTWLPGTVQHHAGKTVQIHGRAGTWPIVLVQDIRLICFLDDEPVPAGRPQDPELLAAGVALCSDECADDYAQSLGEQRHTPR
jgi:hypothetical protein